MSIHEVSVVTARCQQEAAEISPFAEEGRGRLHPRWPLWWWQQTWGWRHRRSCPTSPSRHGCHRSTGRSSPPGQRRDGTCSVAQLAATYLRREDKRVAIFYQRDWSYKIWKRAPSCRRWLPLPQSQHSLSELRFTFISSDLVCAFACKGDKIILENMSFIFLQLCLHHYLGVIPH